jgi:epoxyqueuosine reductase
MTVSIPQTPTHAPAGHALAAEVKSRAAALGFDLVGIAPAEPSRYRQYLRQWIDDGQAGTMSWMRGRFDERTDPATYLPGARSVVCVALNYYVDLHPTADPDAGRQGRIARYALGDDYHEIIKARLRALADWMREAVPSARTRACVDTAPLMEKELAARAGVGWVGKNTCLIHPRAGSWLLLGEIVTTIDLPTDEPATDHCGTCTRCLDACPTGALFAPYQLDARRCISYLTIEHRGDIEPELRRQIGDWLYGCDICQDVCPHNRRPPSAADPALKPRFPAGSLDVDEVLGWGEGEYRTRLRKSAMKRVKLPILRRNARIVAENLGPQSTRTGGNAEAANAD